jgi:hypothetical protein
MPPANDLPSASFALAVGLCLIATFLGLRQWYERRARDPELSDADHAHFVRQDARRRLGVLVMLGIAVLVLVGSRAEARVQGRMNLFFLEIWVAVLALIMLLLVLALADWSATRNYARRHREILRESIAAIRRDRKVAHSSRSLDTGDPDPDEPHV